MDALNALPVKQNVLSARLAMALKLVLNSVHNVETIKSPAPLVILMLLLQLFVKLDMFLKTVLVSKLSLIAKL